MSLLAACVMAALIVPAQKIFAVVVAVRCAHDNMDMVAVMFFELWKRLAGLMIEFDDEDRAMNAVIEDALLLDSAAPGEMGVMKMQQDFVHLHSGVTRPHAPDVNFHQAKEPIMLPRRQLIVSNPLIA